MNVVLVVLDTLRKDKLSVYNDSIDFTPNIDGFAEDADVFENVFAQAPWTLPSQASIFTGQYPWEHGATERKIYLETDVDTLAERFSKKGYRTACYTTNPFITPFTGMTEGFEEVDNYLSAFFDNFLSERLKKIWLRINNDDGLLFKVGEKILQFFSAFRLDINVMNTGPAESKTEEIIEKASRFIKSSVNSGEDFFLYINLMDAHEPYYPDEKYKNKHAPDVDPKRTVQNLRDYFRSGNSPDLSGTEALHDACVEYMDHHLGRLFNFLNREQIKDDTVVVVTSDHGQLFGEEKMFSHCFSVSEKLISVPLIVRSPHKNGFDTESLLELKDLYRLIPGLAGVSDSGLEPCEFAMGGQDYPNLHLNMIPERSRKRFENTISFVRGKDRKIIKYSGEEVDYEMVGLPAGRKVPLDKRYVECVDSIDFEGPSGVARSANRKIKKRLRKLGYM